MTCLNCNKELKKKQRKFCSAKCKYDYWYKNHRKEHIQVVKEYYVKNKKARLAYWHDYYTKYLKIQKPWKNR